ncbi:adenine nucleotide alpha hydrolases-like protein [Meredithblackwellia eburnea MCA 4105]
MHRKIPSFSITGSKPIVTPPTPTEPSGQSLAAGGPAPVRDSSRSRSRGRSLSPFRRKKRDESAEGVSRDAGESEYESDADPTVCPSNAFETSDEEDEEEWSEPDEEDEILEKNTELNSSERTPYDFLSQDTTMVFPGEGTNLNDGPDLQDPTVPRAPSGSTLKRRGTKSEKAPALVLNNGRPIFEKNRCTITLTHGDPDEVGKTRRTRKYLVASDLSEESLYAIQWAIGTVLRDGDECMIVSVIETDTKFDPEDGQGSASEKKAKISNQKDRQVNASMLSRQATALLERTRLNVRVLCQCIHAKNVRHMLLDMIDYHEPTMVIVGTRGLKKVKGMLLGSVSNYLLQKSSVPVMVTRRPLRLARTVHKRLSMLNRESRVPLAEAAIEKDSQGGAAGDDPSEPPDIAEQVKKLEISDGKNH